MSWRLSDPGVSETRVNTADMNACLSPSTRGRSSLCSTGGVLRGVYVAFYITVPLSGAKATCKSHQLEASNQDLSTPPEIAHFHRVKLHGRRRGLASWRGGLLAPLAGGDRGEIRRWAVELPVRMQVGYDMHRHSAFAIHVEALPRRTSLAGTCGRAEAYTVPFCIIARPRSDRSNLYPPSPLRGFA